MTDITMHWGKIIADCLKMAGYPQGSEPDTIEAMAYEAGYAAGVVHGRELERQEIVEKEMAERDSALPVDVSRGKSKLFKE